MKTRQDNAEKRSWIRFGVKLVILITISYLIFGVAFGFQRIEGVAMSPELKDGDLSLFLRLNDDYAVNDVVIYTHDEKNYAARIIAVANDLVTINKNGELYVNGDPVSEAPVYDEAELDNAPISYPQRVATDSYFVLNENLDATEDSREFGVVLKTDIKGKIITLLRTRIE